MSWKILQKLPKKFVLKKQQNKLRLDQRVETLELCKNHSICLEEPAETPLLYSNQG